MRGKVDQAKGWVKQSVGDLRNDEKLRRGRRKVGEAIQGLGHKVSR